MIIRASSGLLLCLALLAISTNPAAAQEKPRPARTKMDTPPASPEILADGGVTFRFRAPNAKEVKVSGQFGPETTLTKGEGGLWSATVPRVQPGVYEYHFSVDGLSVLDPLNPAIKPQRQPGSNILHVPANPPAPWDLQDIPHGVLHQHTYFSKALQTWRQLVIYTPPGYSAAGESLPVLYLSHGFSDNEQTWTVHGKAHWILDSLIAQKKANPMLVVMPDGHAIPPGTGWKDEYGRDNTNAYIEELIGDVLPLVEAGYNVAGDAQHRAFAGLSMGGRHALSIALTQSDKFSAIGAFSAAPPEQSVVEAAFKDAAGLNARLSLLWIGVGKDDFLIKPNEAFIAAAKEAGVKYEWHLTGGNHSWPVWRNYLAEFAPLLFQK